MSVLLAVALLEVVDLVVVEESIVLVLVIESEDIVLVRD